MYNETALDPKLRLIAFRAGTPHANVIAVWTCMLCHASSNKGELRGTLAGWNDDEYAFHIGIDRAILFAIRKEMEGRILDGNRIIAWSGRQFDSDTSRSRMQRLRERRKADRTEGETHPEEKQEVSP